MLLPTALVGHADAQVLNAQKLLDTQTFWDNRDWDWYRANIPFFDSPDAEINTTYYYRWELVTKHLTYGSPESGYSFTEFIDRPFWSGAYGSISCPAGHQLYEVRWLKDASVARDYARYWFKTPGAEPRRYSTWLADTVSAVARVQGDDDWARALLPELQANYAGWEKSNYVPEIGLFWQTGHDDGMEININSRQTQDTVRGAPGFRPTLNAYLAADALAISRLARKSGDAATADKYAAKAADLRKRLNECLWDAKREFYLQRYKNDEQRDGHHIKAGTLTYESGKFAGSPHGREQIGYVPWQFNLADAGREVAWRFLADPKFFAAEYGPTTVERKDPMFALSKGCCWWSGQSWPYATTQTLVAMANLLNQNPRTVVTEADYFKLLRTYTLTHRKNGRPYIAEAANPDTGSWEGHDAYNHSEHYFHSGYNDLIITGLVGLRPRDDDVIEVNSLAPDDWDYFALDDVAYRGRRLAIIWDRDGKRYGKGAGLSIIVDGKTLATSRKLDRLIAAMPSLKRTRSVSPRPLNYAVNNSGSYYPRAITSHTSDHTSAEQAIDGNYWYHVSPPNRWTCFGSTADQDWFGVDFGVARQIDTVKLYLLDDTTNSDTAVRAPEGLRREKIATPAKIALQSWDGKAWQAIADASYTPATPTGRRTNVVTFSPLKTSRLRAVLTHAAEAKSGLSEFEASGPGTLPVPSAPPPVGNLALNTSGKGFPLATASHTSRFDQVAMANDGRISWRDKPHNRWTSYESKNKSDSLAIDFGAEKAVGRVDLYIYDDHGGVQAPSAMRVEWWNGKEWKPVEKPSWSPEKPAGRKVNSATFTPVKSRQIRVVFEHRGEARSGISEIEVYAE